jgi:hypothetical protein
MPTPTPYINAVELDIVPAQYEKFKAAILENAAASVKEPGCRQFCSRTATRTMCSCTRSTTTQPPWRHIAPQHISKGFGRRPRP